MFPITLSRKEKIEALLTAYRGGFFPMAEGRFEPVVSWLNPELRGIMPLMGFTTSRSLRRTLGRELYTVTVDQNFREVIGKCAETNESRTDTWINGEIMDVYTELFEKGYAHSVECWDGECLAGGLYGVSIGAAFFGESMFSRRSDASKIALAHLVARLLVGGYLLLDIQFVTKHLKKMGAIEISRADYLRRLGQAVNKTADFHFLSSTGGRDSIETPVSGLGWGKE